MKDEVKRHCIYKITSLKDGKVYIGQTLNIKNRWKAHIKESKRDRPELPINRAMKKHGIENFAFEIIATIDEPCDCYNRKPGKCKTIAEDIETQLISQYKSHISLGMGYNVVMPNFSIIKKRVSWPSNNKLVKMVNEKGITSIAHHLNVTTQNLRKHIKRHNIKCNPPSNNSFVKGSNHIMAKVSDQDALDIVRMCRAEKYTHAEIGKMFDICAATVTQIICGYTREDITGIKRREKSVAPKLNSEIAKEIVRLDKLRELNQKQIANKLGINPNTVSDVLLGYAQSNATGIKSDGIPKIKRMPNKDILNMVELYQTGQYMQKELATKFNVSIETISNVVCGVYWSDITGIKKAPKGSEPKRSRLLKLTKEDVLEIVRLYKNEKLSDKELAEKFNVQANLISRIITGARHSKITGIQYTPKKPKQQ
jgi:group I intron endonuclease